MSKSKTVDKKFIPCTPAGSLLLQLEANSEQEAWGNLLARGSHSKVAKAFDEDLTSVDAYKRKGYTIYCWDLGKYLS